MEAEKIEQFLAELTAISQRYAIGINCITLPPVLFVMEPDDSERAYRVDAESQLTFA